LSSSNLVIAAYKQSTPQSSRPYSYHLKSNQSDSANPLKDNLPLPLFKKEGRKKLIILWEQRQKNLIVFSPSPLVGEGGERSK